MQFKSLFFSWKTKYLDLIQSKFLNMRFSRKFMRIFLHPMDPFQASKVPLDVGLLIARLLEIRDLGRLSQTCKFWNSCCSDDRLWKDLFYENGEISKYLESTLEKSTYDGEEPPEWTPTKEYPSWKVLYRELGTYYHFA
jgi:hypothetical protein